MLPAAAPRPGANDYALILAVAGQGVGVAGLGAERRANAFLDWALSPLRGGLPGNHVHALIGEESTIGRASLRQMVYELIPDLDARLEDGGTVGRRCYLYLAGQAIDLGQEVRLMARDEENRPLILDASLQRFTNYLTVRRIFDEVVTIADVGLPPIDVQTSQMPVFPDVEPAPRGSEAEVFAALSAARGDTLRLRDAYDSGNGEPSLGFTGAIIGALSGGARDGSQAITAESLVSYVGRRLGLEWGPSAEMPRFQYRTASSFEFFSAPSTDQPPARLPNARALIIGIDKYRTIPGLATCASDARAIAEALSDPLVGGYQRENVHLLTNYSATRAEVVNMLAQVSVAEEDAPVFIYFSGRASAEDGEITLWCSDDDLSDRDGVLTASKLNLILDKFVSKNVVLALDTSEGAVGISAPPGRMVLSATLPGEAAYSSQELGFSLYLLQALYGAAGEGDDLTVFDLFEYAHASVVTQRLQHPNILRDPSQLDFVIAKRPLDSANANRRNADGSAYDVYVVFSLASPRAEFVEHTVLPALRDAGLSVVISEPLQGAPVGRVMGVDRGIRLSRKTLMLVTPALQSEFQYGVVVDSLYTQPPLLNEQDLIVVDLEPSVDHVGQGVTWEDFDLVSAKTARHSSVRRLIDRLRGEPTQSAANAPNIPLIEVADDRDRVTRDAWLLPASDSEWVMKLASSDEPSRALPTATMQPGDIAFARDQTEASRVLGMTRVNRAFKPKVSPTPTGRVRSYQLERPLRFEIPKSLEHLLGRGMEDGDPQTRAALLDRTDSRMLAAMCVASNPLAVARVEEWMGEGVVGFVLDACIAALRWSTSDRDHVLPGLLPHLSREAVVELLRAARMDQAIHNGAATRAVVRHVKQTRPEALPAVANFLRDDSDPAARAIGAALLEDPAERAKSFRFSCFFDVSADRSLYPGLVDRVVEELKVIGARPVLVATSTEDRETTSDDIRDSACVVFVPARDGMSGSGSRRLRIANSVAASRTKRFVRKNLEVPKSVVFIDPMRLSAQYQPHIERIVATGLQDDESVERRVAARLIDIILATCQLLDETPPPPRRTRAEVIDRMTVDVGSLLEQTADAIVNPVGIRPTVTSQIGFQIGRRLGGSVVPRGDAQRTLQLGETVVRPTDGRLPSRYVVNVCVDDDSKEGNSKGIALGASEAMATANGLIDVETVAFPEFESRAGMDARQVARGVMAAVLDSLSDGSFIQSVRFVLRDESIAAIYRETLDEIRFLDAPSKGVADATRWFVSLRQTSLGSILVGGDVGLAISFSRELSAGAISFDVPHSALELTIYVDAGAAFHLEGPSQLTVQTHEGDIGVASIPITVLALTDGDHAVRVALNAPGARTAGELTQAVHVEAAISLPDIPELIDPRAIPTPEPDFLLYVAFEETRTTAKIRLHVTSSVLGLRRHRLDQALFLNKNDVAAIQLAAADVAADVDALSPSDARGALQRFGAMLYDVLMPPGHELREILNRLFVVPQRAGRPLTWLVVSDEAAMLPWELVCPYGVDNSYTRQYGDFLAGWFAIGQWVGRRGFELATEVPMGPIGIVHYGQQADARAHLRAALGQSEASDADRTRGLDILQTGSPYFGVHLLRFSDPLGSTDITEAGSRASVDGSSLDGDRRLDFTLRRPLITLSLVDSALEAGGQIGPRFANLERAWAIPMLLARVSSVVGPRWTTSPDADRTFYRAFYDALRGDRPIGVALWEARDRVRAAHPSRADWLAYTQFGHPAGAPYPVEEAEGFAMFEPVGMDDDEPFVAGKTYSFRASFRAEPPAWFGGRRRRRVARFDGSGTRLLVDAPFEKGAKTYDLVGAGDADGDDYYCVVEMTMPLASGTHDVFIQFTRGKEKLRSTFIPFDVVDEPSASEQTEARSV